MILVVGGTGTLGRPLVLLLAARGLPVRVLARHARPLADSPEVGSAPRAADVRPVEFVAGDIRDPGALERALAGADTVISAVTGFGPGAPGSRAIDRDANRALIRAAARAGVGHLILLSVHNAGPDHPIELFRDKWAAEEALRASSLEWTIVRPTAYLETWLGFVGGPLVATGRTRVLGHGRNPINFVSVSDVARFVELAVVDPSLRGRAIDVPGPENLTLDELARVAGSVAGRVPSIRHLPPIVMRVVAATVGRLNPSVGALVTAGLVMDTRDMSVDGPAVRAAFPSIPMTSAAEVAARLF